MVEVGAKLGPIIIGGKGADGQDGPEQFEPKGMKVGGDGNPLVGSQKFAQSRKLEKGYDLIDCHELVSLNIGRIESLSKRPYPGNRLLTESGVMIGKEFQIRAFARSAGSVKDDQSFLLKRLIFQPEEVVKAFGGLRFSSHALKNSSCRKAFGLPFAS